jgi:hypothetical protein
MLEQYVNVFFEANLVEEVNVVSGRTRQWSSTRSSVRCAIAQKHNRVRS